MTEGHHQQSPIVPAEVDMSLPVEVVMAISTYLRLQTGRWYLEVSLIGLPELFEDVSGQLQDLSNFFHILVLHFTSFYFVAGVLLFCTPLKSSYRVQRCTMINC